MRIGPCPTSAKGAVFVVSEILSVVFGGLVPGFLLGLLAFRVKARWCPRCGEYTEPINRADRR